MKRKLLTLLVKYFHRKQERKCTGEPYYTHCEKVADLTQVYGLSNIHYEIGLCHDLLEDTTCTGKKLRFFLRLFGYSRDEANYIVYGVKWLTDKYTKENYPDMNRANRKRLEAIRLSQALPDIQTVKYCDMMDNTVDIAFYDKKFSKTYLKEKRYALNMIVEGNEKLRHNLIDITNSYAN